MLSIPLASLLHSLRVMISVGDANMLESTSQSVYTDVQSMTQLRQQARDDPNATLKIVAKHFESLYMNMMLKSMRAASFGDPNFDSNSSSMYRDMYDSQISLHLSNEGGFGLADMLVKQLQNGIPGLSKETQSEASETEISVRAEKSDGSVNKNKALRFNPSIRIKPQADQSSFNSKQDFVHILMPLAEQAAEELDVAPQVLIAQAALETGWGKHMQRLPNGQSSYNLFNIKADQRWDGPKVNLNALEYKDGIAEKSKSSFRVYGSLKESFEDYVRFIKSNPRYEMALEKANNPEAYTYELQKAGYATDPRYAEKINNIYQREIVGAPYSEYLVES